MQLVVPSPPSRPGQTTANSRPTFETVPNQAVRDRAVIEIARLREEAISRREDATSLEREANALEDSIRVARTIFDTDSSECVNFDTYFAGQFRGLAEEMQQVTTKIHDIYNSFCPTGGITCWDTMFAIKAGMSDRHQDELFNLTVNAIVAQIMGDGDINWDMIEAILDRPYDQIRDVEYYALFRVFMTLESEEYLTKFIQLLADPTMIYPLVPGSFSYNQGLDNTPLPLHEFLAMTQGESNVVFWSFCPEKINRLRVFAEFEAMVLSLQPSERYDEAQINRLLERSALLMTVANSTGAFEAMPGITTMKHTIMGDASGPFVNINIATRDNHSYYLNFTRSEVSVVHNPNAGRDLKIVNNNHNAQHTIPISTLQVRGDITHTVLDNFEDHILNHFSTSNNPNWVGGAGDALWKTARDAVVLGAFGKYKVPGKILLGAFDIWNGNESRNRANQRVQDNVLPGIDAARRTPFHVQFNLQAVIVNEGGPHQNIITWPRARTFDLVEAINDHIRYHNLESQLPSGLTYPVCVFDDVLRENPALDQFFRDLPTNTQDYIIDSAVDIRRGQGETE